MCWGSETPYLGELQCPAVARTESVPRTVGDWTPSVDAPVAPMGIERGWRNRDEVQGLDPEPHAAAYGALQVRAKTRGSNPSPAPTVMPQDMGNTADLRFTFAAPAARRPARPAAGRADAGSAGATTRWSVESRRIAHASLLTRFVQHRHTRCRVRSGDWRYRWQQH